MKTKDFIAMLQKEDPSGEGYIRMDGGVPYMCEAKEGYYDGPYSYLDEDGNYCTSITGYKIDIYSKDRNDFILDAIWDDQFDINGEIEQQWEELKKTFKFNLSLYGKDVQERKLNEYWEDIRKKWEQYRTEYIEYKKGKI